MRLRFLFSLAVFLAATGAYGADLTGNWLVKQESPDGNVRETYFDLKQDGTNVTGSMRSVSFDRKIQSVLTMAGQNNRPGQRIQAKFTNGVLLVTMGSRGGTGGEELTA